MLILKFPWIYFSKSRNPSKNNQESREPEISLFLFMNEVQAGYARFPFWHSFSGARREVQDMAAVGGTIQLPQGNVKVRETCWHSALILIDGPLICETDLTLPSRPCFDAAHLLIISSFQFSFLTDPELSEFGRDWIFLL